MPGFTSFLLGHGRFSVAVQGSTQSQSDDELETDASKQHRLRLERRRALQVSRIHGTVMTRKDTAYTLAMLKQLNSDIDAQIETFHDIGVASEKKRREAINEFTMRGHLILKDGVRVLDQFEDAQGAVQTLSEGFMELSQVMVAGGPKNRKVDVVDVQGVVLFYQRQILKPLGDVIKELGKILDRKEGWTDPR